MPDELHRRRTRSSGVVTEADRWRKQAHEALAKFSSAMDFFLFAAAELARLSTIHFPDEFSHCSVCREPWPCETIMVIKRIGNQLHELQRSTARHAEEGKTE